MKKELIVEIRQGIGGDESISFVKDLYKMYLKFFEKKNINYKVIKNNNFKELILKIESSVYDSYFFKEAGIHRVQRIPKSENQGRVHTSTCTIFININNFEKKFFLNNKDIKIETCKSSGSGGQHVNTTNSSVKVTHLKSNISIECSDERSQHLNKNKAITMLKNKVLKIKNEKKKIELNSTRKNIIFNPERSKKIRTYNFPNNKIIDHLKNKTYNQLLKIINGDLDIIFKN